MSDKKISQHFENLSEDAHKYIESEIAFYKLNAYKIAVKASSLLIRLLLIGALTLLLFSFLAIALGLLLGKMLGNYYAGFFIISGIFLIFLLVVFLFSKPVIERKTISLFNNILHE